MNQAADNAAAPQTAGAAAGGGFVPGAVFDPGLVPPSPETRPAGRADEASTVNYVNSQTFVRQGDGAPDSQGRARYQWVDARFDKSQRNIRVQSFSDEYFELLGDYPELGDYLAQGENVVLVLEGGIALETTDEDVTVSEGELRELRGAIERANL
jgi:hypothetical protein